jgi:hypothetical protein
MTQINLLKKVLLYTVANIDMQVNFCISSKKE